MKKLIAIALALVLALSFAACTPAAEAPAPEETPAAEAVTIKVGATPTPHAEILTQVKEQLAAEGVNLEIVEYTDYVQPNLAVESGELDANYFQHQPYLDDFNAENDTHIVTVAAIHYEPLGIYPGKTATLDALADGAQIAVPNDTTNEARALLLLEANGIITLKEGVGMSATKIDIVENPKNVEIIEIEAAQVPRSLADVDLGVINGNYALEAGLKGSDALATEDKDSIAADTYANVVCVKEGNEQNEAIQKLVAAMQSETVKSYIDSTYEGVVVPKF